MESAHVRRRGRTRGRHRGLARRPPHPLPCRARIGDRDLAERQGLELATVTGDVDLGTPTGRIVARILGAAAQPRGRAQGRTSASRTPPVGRGRHRSTAAVIARSGSRPTRSRSVNPRRRIIREVRRSTTCGRVAVRDLPRPPTTRRSNAVRESLATPHPSPTTRVSPNFWPT